MKKVLSAVGSDSIYEILKEYEYELLKDIPYQEGVLEIVKREFIDGLILFSELDGSFNKYMFIEKIREIDSKIKIFVIMSGEDDNYKNFLFTKGIFNIFINEKTSKDELINAINNELSSKALKFDLRQKNIKDDKLDVAKSKNENKSNLMPKFQKQQVISFVGLSSSGKTTISSQISTLIAKNSKAKVLLIDFDTINSGVNQFFGIKRSPKNPDYILPSDKNSSLNYMVDAIDKRTFDSNIFEKYVVKSKQYQNLDILTGNKSLYVCEKVLSIEYYSRILEKAKELYDFIIIDTSSNVFIDSTQFTLLNSNKIFYIAEPTYISFERTFRALKEIFPIWGVNNKKIQLIINKYHKKSISKSVIEEMMKEVPISAYISFSEKYDENLNIGKPYVLENEFEYIGILENLEVLPKRKVLNMLKERCFKAIKPYGEVENVNRSV